MAGRDYHHEDDGDRKRHDTYDAPVGDHGESTTAGTGAGQHAPQSLAEIDARYGGTAVASADTGAPDLDQLSLHGVAPEASHADPATTAVAQAELETGTSAAAPREQAADAGDAAGPETGTVRDPMPPEDKAGGAHDAVPASPASVLGGAAQALGTAAEATPGAATTTAAPVTTAAAPATAAAPGAPHDGGQAGAASSWQDSARAYNQHHGMVEAFNAATHNACGSGAEADPDRVAAWQSAHGLSPDGRIGHLTLGAATQPAAARAEAPHAETPHAEAPKAQTPHAEAPHAEAPHAKAAEATAHAPVPTAAPAPRAAATTAPATADSFTGTDDLKGPGKDRWTSYGKDEKKTYGWDLGGTHGVKNSGGDAGAAIYAVSNVEGRYDSVQTYDAGILSFGIMQWTLHAGSLQRFLGFLKDKSGPEGRAAFQDDFAAKGIDVKPTGGQYQLSYHGKEYPLGSDGAGKAAIEKLVREDKATARTWSEIFAAAGADSRVQKAQFEHAKAMYKETQGITFGNKIVDQSLKACKNTFHAKYRELYGKAEGWMSASPKAAALFFSMRVNNPMYANAAFLKAIDAFYDAHGTDRARWPSNWGEHFGTLVADKSAETLSSWGKEDGNEGRVDKTLRFWNKAHAGAPASSTAAPATQTPAPAAAAKAAKTEAAPEAAPDTARQKKLRAQYASIMKQFSRGKIDQGEAVKSLITYDQKLNGGTTSIEGLVLLPILLVDLVRVALTRSTSSAPAKQAPATAAARSVPVTEHKATAPAEHAQAPEHVEAPKHVEAHHEAPKATEHHEAPKAAEPVHQVVSKDAAGASSGKAASPEAHAAGAGQLPPALEHMAKFVYEIDAGGATQKALVFVSGGQLTLTPDVFMFFHGQWANYGIDAKQLAARKAAEQARIAREKGEPGKDPKKIHGDETAAYLESGRDATEEAMQHAQGKNVISILPQGVMGGGGSTGGHMATLTGKGGGLHALIDSVMSSLQKDLHGAKLKPGRISIAGHSAGGYMGIHEALANAGEDRDTITDVTLMDAEYNGSQFANASDWLLQGKPGKSFRIVASPEQLATQRHLPYFGPDTLHAHAEAKGFTVVDKGGVGQARGPKTSVMYHAQIMKGSEIHGDVLILKTKMGHHEIRDNVLDDSILNIGNGGKGGGDTYGTMVHGVPSTEGAGQKTTDATPAAARKPADTERTTAPATKPDESTAHEHDAGAHGGASSTPAAGGGGDHKVGANNKRIGGVHSAPPDASKLTHAGDADMTKFKQEVYKHNLEVVRSSKHVFFPGLQPDDLESIGRGDHVLRHDAAASARSLLGKMDAALAAAQAAKDPHALRVKHISIVSSYRDIDVDFGLWDDYFMKYFNEMKPELSKIPESEGGMYGTKAVKTLGHYISIYKAMPGYSNHTAGKALDFGTDEIPEKGGKSHHYGASKKDTEGWRTTWLRQWMEANASADNWEPYAPEMWHWQFRG